MTRPKSTIPAAPELRLLAITRRRSMSPSLAAFVAALAFGPEPREHAGLLASITASRVGSPINTGAAR